MKQIISFTSARVGLLCAGLILGGAACSSPDSEGNTPPVANAGLDITAALGADGEAVIMLDAAQSYDPEGGALSFDWTMLEGPGQPDWSFDERGLDFLEVRLRAQGLYVFQVEVTDPEGAVARDLVNVQINEGGDLPDADMDLPDMEMDMGVEADMDVDMDPPDMAPDMDVEADMGPDAEAPNTAPEAVVEASPERGAVGELFTLSAANSLNDGPEMVSYRWRLVSAPFGVQGDFPAPGDVPEATFTADEPGRYTFEVRVSDGEYEDRATVSIYVTGAPAYALTADTRAIWPVDPETGLSVAPPIQWQGGGRPLMMAARAGVLYIVTESTEVSPGTLIILAPGRQEVRRALPRGAIIRGLYPTVDGVWLLSTNTSQLWFTDPLGELTLQPVALPETYPNGGGLTIEGPDVWVSSTFSEAGVMRLDGEARAFESVAVDTANRCNPRDLAVEDGWLYLACRNQGAVARVPQDFEGSLEWSSAITVGNIGQRAEQMIVSGGYAVVRHSGSAVARLIPVDRFELATDDPQRQPGALPSVALSGVALDLIAGGDLIYALVRRGDGEIALDSFDPEAPDQVRSLSLGPVAVTDLVFDAAEAPSFSLDPL